MRCLIVVVALVASACGSGAPASPSAPTVVLIPNATPVTTTVTGHVTATNGGQPLSGLSATLGTTVATTDGAGTFTAQTPQTTSVNLRLTGSTIVPRSLTVGVSASRDLAVNAIALGGSFDLNFYRQLVRNGFEGGNEPLRRWTVTPSIRIRTVDDAGRPIPAVLVDMAATVAADAVPAWTGLRPITIDRAPDANGAPGWLTVGWADHPDSTKCGEAVVGGTSISLFYLNGSDCACFRLTSQPPMSTRIIRHEFGHAFGFWHTDSVDDVMNNPGSFNCDATPSARELLHAKIAYSRPVGNVDPDTDPGGTVNLTPMRVP